MIVFSVQKKYVTYFSGKNDIWLIFCEKYVFQERGVERGGDFWVDQRITIRFDVFFCDFTLIWLG